MIKFISTALAIALLCGILSGCAPKEPMAEDFLKEYYFYTTEDQEHWAQNDQLTAKYMSNKFEKFFESEAYHALLVNDYWESLIIYIALNKINMTADEITVIPQDDGDSSIYSLKVKFSDKNGSELGVAEQSGIIRCGKDGKITYFEPKEMYDLLLDAHTLVDGNTD